MRETEKSLIAVGNKVVAVRDGAANLYSAGDTGTVLGASRISSIDALRVKLSKTGEVLWVVAGKWKLAGSA